MRTLLFLVADTGGGHRSAAGAVVAALEGTGWRPVLFDPLTGPAAPRPVRCLARLYGPMIRRAPWLWGLIYRLTDSRPAVALLHRTLLRPVARTVAEAAATHDADAVVSFHALATGAAVRTGRPSVTVVTDLASTHTAWLRGRVVDGLGVPVSPRFTVGIPRRDGPFTVLVIGGAEGAGGMRRRVSALLGAGVRVVAICGRNERLRRRLERLRDERLTTLGYVDDVSPWMRAADVVVTKAGPGTIAEATCCGVPLVITSHVPGQERGNTELVVSAGAGRAAAGVNDLVRVVAELIADPRTLASMRVASARLGRPGAAREIAEIVLSVAGAERRPEPAGSIHA